MFVVVLCYFAPFDLAVVFKLDLAIRFVLNFAFCHYKTAFLFMIISIALV